MTQQSDMKNIAGESMDLTEHNIEQLRQIFPNVFTEGKIDFDALQAELGVVVEKDSERYQFTWNGKEQAKRIATTPTLGTLRPCQEESVDWEATENLFIEGDNLEVLKLLQKSYFNKVKMIYIDPPYNTGKDFVYKDDFKDNLANYKRLTEQVDQEGNPLTTNTDSSGRYHSNWLNMMYPRLKLARNLLQDDGVIFISIDDNEVHNLIKICEEIFGEDNSLDTIAWQKTFAPKNDSKYFSSEHEYILVYTKDKQKLQLNLLERSDKHNARYKNPDNDPRGEWISTDLLRMEHRENSIYEIISPTGKVWKPLAGTSWRHPETEMLELIGNGEVLFGKDGNAKPRRKRFLKDVKQGVVSQTIWKFDEVSHTQEAKQSLNKLFEAVPTFDTPKPINLLKKCLQLSTGKNDIVLDFFSGSSTTAHAVMLLNAIDEGSRKCISVQIPELTLEKSDARKSGYNTITEISKERIRRAAKKIKLEYPETQVDLGFKVFKLDTSNIKKWQPDLENIETDLLAAVDNIIEDRTSEDLLYEVLIKYGLPLTYPVESITINNHQAWLVAGGALVACFDEGIDLDTVKAIAELKTDDIPLMRVVFRDTSFSDDTVKTNAIQHLKQYGIEDVLSI